jgi:2,3-bisphosphoglycerate-independent phosphoglycerate mutase
MAQLVVLIILDGWGVGKANENNAIFAAKTKNFDKFLKIYPSFVLEAAGKAVGRPREEEGNSERGHLILGSGRSFDEIENSKKPVKNALMEVLSKNNLKQLYISETEKFLYVSYFFGGFAEKPFENVDWVNIPSPEVASFDKNPEMSAKDIAKKIVGEIIANKYNFFAVNFANADMVAHTGDLKATIKAVQTVDSCLGDIVDVALAKDGIVVVTADHGNAEETRPLKEGEILKPHTKNPVPCVIIAKSLKGDFAAPYQKGGTIADVAPTILKFFDIKKPRQMTGKSLV